VRTLAMVETLTGGGDESEVSMASKEWMRPARDLDSRNVRITGMRDAVGQD
jgi:hypothetical protein